MPPPYQRPIQADRITRSSVEYRAGYWLSCQSPAGCIGGTCRLDMRAVCAARSLTRSFVDLGMSPLCESYLPAESVDAPEVFYPLNVLLCGECLLVQLPAYVSGEHIFSDYAYFSSYSDSWVAHAKRYADEMTARLWPDARQPRHRGREQRRLPAPALRRGGHPGARRRAGRQRRQGRRRQGHPDGGGVPRPGHGRRDRRRVRPGGPRRRQQRLRARAGHPRVRGRAARAGQGLRAGDAGVPAPAPADRAAAVRHDLPRALLLPVAADGEPRAGNRRPAGGRRRGAEHARRFAPGPRPARRGRRRALGAGEGGARRGRSGRPAHGRRARGLRRRGAADQERPAHLPASARRPRARRWPATARRARATRC